MTTSAPASASAPASPSPTAATPAWIAPGVAGFLAGATIYLRPHEAGDAQYPAAWRTSPFAITPERAVEVLKDEVPKLGRRRTARYVACRRANDEPVGAVTHTTDVGLAAEVTLHVDPALASEAPALQAEMLGIIAPWLAGEKQYMIASVELDETVPGLVAAATALGMTPAVRFREATWQRGHRRDQSFYALLNPAWVAKLGDPGPGIAVATDPPATARAARRVSQPFTRGEVPAGTILAGPRVVLRLLAPDDWPAAVTQLRQETEVGFERGRWLPSAISLAAMSTEDGKADPPTSIELAVIRRDGGDLLGSVELIDLDLFHRTAETGSMLFSPAVRSQGLGSEAKNLLLEYAFDHLGLHMVRSYVWGRNTRSQAALRKQGYRDAGEFQWESTADGEFVGTRAFDLLATEWRALADAPAPDSAPDRITEPALTDAAV